MPSLADVIGGKVSGPSQRQTDFMVSQSRRKRQFAAVCAAVYNEAKKKGVGREIPAEWFTQSIRD
jgi:hypothetical protein